MRRGDDGIEIGEKILAIDAGGKVLAGIGGKRAETLRLENEFEIFTVHAANSRERSHGWPTLETSPAETLHRGYGVFSSF